jgi:uncharacterized beta-barrel protein YwiB (DUF1934 family)
MNRNVEVFVTGIHQREGEPTEKVETVARGSFEELEDGSRIVEYDEEQDAGGAPYKVHNRVQIEPGGRNMEIIRKGTTSSRLMFGESSVYDTEYLTPYGSMQMKVRTNSFDLNMHGEDEMRVVAEYDLEIEGQVLSRSMIVLDIKNAVAN